MGSLTELPNEIILIILEMVFENRRKEFLNLALINRHFSKFLPIIKEKHFKELCKKEKEINELYKKGIEINENFELLEAFDEFINRNTWELGKLLQQEKRFKMPGAKLIYKEYELDHIVNGGFSTDSENDLESVESSDEEFWNNNTSSA